MDRDSRGQRTSVYKCAPVRCGSVLPRPTVNTATSGEETARTGANGREWGRERGPSTAHASRPQAGVEVTPTRRRGAPARRWWRCR
eukprot:814494-Prymnesium_polylepis.1